MCRRVLHIDSQEGKMAVTTPVNGGCNSDAMCVTTLEMLTNPTPPAGSVTVPTGSPTNDGVSLLTILISLLCAYQSTHSHMHLLTLCIDDDEHS